jgi:hypothetical protein
MSLLRENEDKTISRRLVGDYFKQMGELGEFVFESRVADHPRVLKFRNGKQVLYAIWAVEKMDLKKGQRPRFTETTGSYTLSLPGVRSITVKNLADGAGAMHSQQVSLTNESYTVNYSAKPVFVIYTEN